MVNLLQLNHNAFIFFYDFNEKCFYVQLKFFFLFFNVSIKNTILQLAAHSSTQRLSLIANMFWKLNSKKVFWCFSIKWLQFVNYKLISGCVTIHTTTRQLVLPMLIFGYIIVNKHINISYIYMYNRVLFVYGIYRAEKI